MTGEPHIIQSFCQKKFSSKSQKKNNNTFEQTEILNKFLYKTASNLLTHSQKRSHCRNLTKLPPIAAFTTENKRSHGFICTTRLHLCIGTVFLPTLSTFKHVGRSSFLNCHLVFFDCLQNSKFTFS